MNNILIVDGYNIIGAWSTLRKLRDSSFNDARDQLIEWMAEYQAYSGWSVIVVFDAHLSPGIEKKHKQLDVEVVFTRKNETADERIEKLTLELMSRWNDVYVATSDLTEQRVIFAQGALRKSARELEIEMQMVEKKISKKVNEIKVSRPISKINLQPEIAEIFEKWRRGRQ